MREDADDFIAKIRSIDVATPVIFTSNYRADEQPKNEADIAFHKPFGQRDLRKLVLEVLANRVNEVDF